MIKEYFTSKEFAEHQESGNGAFTFRNGGNFNTGVYIVPYNLIFSPTPIFLPWFSSPNFNAPSPLNILPNSLTIEGKRIFLPISLFQRYFLPHIFFPNRLDKQGTLYIPALIRAVDLDYYLMDPYPEIFYNFDLHAFHAPYLKIHNKHLRLRVHYFYYLFPSEASLLWTKEVKSVDVCRGQMIDMPTVKQAQNVLQFS